MKKKMDKTETTGTESYTIYSTVPSENNFREHSLARHHHMSLRMIEQNSAGKRKVWSFFADRFCPVTQEKKEREAERKRKTNRAGGGALRGGGGGFSALACHLSLAVLGPQLLLVQSTVTGREPGARLRKHPHSHFTCRAEEEPARLCRETRNFCGRADRSPNPCKVKNPSCVQGRVRQRQRWRLSKVNV